MTMRWSYIGELGPNDRLDWGGDNTCNIPVSGQFLPDWNDNSLYFRIKQFADCGEFEGRQIDWGAWAVKVNGPELQRILSDCYGDLDAVKPDVLLGRYVSFAKELGEDHRVALVACAM
jgi:hypothetical protein